MVLCDHCIYDIFWVGTPSPLHASHPSQPEYRVDANTGKTCASCRRNTEEAVVAFGYGQENCSDETTACLPHPMFTRNESAASGATTGPHKHVFVLLIDLVECDNYN